MIGNTLAVAVSLLFRFLEGAILLEVILSWIMPGRSNKLTDILSIFTGPFMIPGRKIQEKLMPGFMIDFSPIIALFILDILQRIIYSIL
ncbi:YggT family protein [Clostridium sp. CX1]|uniref:YggT family protein n=1 Tax=Clostridium tanneri TaxID=3037988 RepID=A0ABU4JN94_9CLOT|nr:MULTISPECIES: YggT family protein [unclassified Clostridium]MCT8976066.1 YggT family protein [Clostridium sp. CX1]MDW8799618.1 YggT family protein [Clostridium sp. A1-XYC3]